MDLLEAIYHRRATRAFTHESVDEPTVRALIEAAGAACAMLPLSGRAATRDVAHRGSG